MVEPMTPPATPRLLILETSSGNGFVALSAGSTMLEVRRLDQPRRHARDLAPAVRELFAQHKWKPADVDAVVVSIGPGSYTGLRVGIMSAKAFCYATSCRLIAIETFAAIAAQAPAHVVEIDVFADAQQDRVYVQRFSRAHSGGDWAPNTELAIKPFADWLLDPGKAAYATGTGLRGKENRLPPDVQMADEAYWEPQPDSLLKLALARFAEGQFADPWAVEPLYLRPSAAEQQWDRK